ncbi:hypothetical protein ACS47_06525 [Bacillus cereus]|uniref:Uncharacterized protein n=1 Tax=Bacillus paranthracis TaxID=2026186 RepID=A0A7D8D6X5_9BACI|nr:hypothetical protein IAU_01435 [Bacillus cereus IS075]EJQ01901.1 hypothetical protein IC5_03581 [Bacillus cereus AND1407]EJR20639.1 hypothetical protein II7_00671 [Bacillus cereus MSX-A12]EOO89045.1 hypothetical protein IGS_02828 [Bacillus cereus IS845/00]EOO96865.1 hypothetical protein IGQ_02580 [Bacillus cereus IS195]KFK74861.1 putative membrane protein [Bacillus cereus]NHA29144.1 hypothetical protein [Bacillus paranthracis]BAL19276.1 conserved hypothetical protein [Bacillus cereus NC74
MSTLFTGMVPLLVKVSVYVMKSPRWALFTFAVLINVFGSLGFTSIVIGGVVVVVVIGGLVESG